MDTGKNEFHSAFSVESFWDKILKFAKSAGIKVIYVALLLFYTLGKEDLPVWVKPTIIAVLGYFISPVDAIPDLLPGGYADDLGALIMALSTVAIYIDEDVRNKAKTKLRDIFGDIDDEDVSDIDGKLGLD